MHKKIIILLSILLCAFILIYYYTIFNQYKCKTKEELPSKRAKQYLLTITDSSGTPLANKTIHIKQLRQNFLINNRDKFTNYKWIETTNPQLRNFESKKNITPQDILTDLRLIKNKPNTDNSQYIMLVIPVSFPNNVMLSEYSNVETHMLQTYYQAFQKANIIPDFIQILPEFNQKMELQMHFSKNKAMQFVDKYIRQARSLFPKSKLILSLGPLYCLNGFYSPIVSGACLHELKTHQIIDNFEFLSELEQKHSPYDIIGIEYQIGSHHSPKFKNFETFFNKLSSFQKPIFIWEYWVLSNNIPKSDPLYKLFIQNKPENGWTENYQKTIFSKTLAYIDSHPFIIGIANFGWKDGQEVAGSTERMAGLIRSNNTKKPSYYVMKHWYNSWFTECNLTSDSNGHINFTSLPGKFKISINAFKHKIIDLNNKANYTIRF